MTEIEEYWKNKAEFWKGLFIDRLENEKWLLEHADWYRQRLEKAEAENEELKERLLKFSRVN